MKRTLINVPVYETRSITIRAEHYNLVRIALKRLSSPVQLDLPRLRTLSLELDEETWIIADKSLNNVPVMAWLDFQPSGDSLHQPVPCRLNLYHAHADKIYDRTLEAMTLILGERLPSSDDHSHTVVSISDDE